MAKTTSGYDDQDLSLCCFQIYNLFEKTCVDSLLNQPVWVDKYPDIIKSWKSSDELMSSRVVLAGEIILSIARECVCVGDFFSDPDGETLHITTKGDKPCRFYKDLNGQMVVEKITDAIKISTEQAIIEYGADAIWLAQEYGKSRRGERDNRFRIL